ncbi:MAG: peptide chain release factor N(5)-glutamine methyltransferase [Paracoccaceae bacterium]
MSADPTVAEALRQATARLVASGVESAPGDARRLMAHALAIGADRLTLVLPDRMGPEALARFDQLIAARQERQPVSQIIGQRAFFGRDFQVTPDVLDPRPETELLVSLALEGGFHRLLDLGTGTGCLILTLLAERPAAKGLAVDLSAKALGVARTNAAALGLSARAEFRQSDWWDAVDGTFDLIISNPPYIAAAEMGLLAPEVLRWEPHLALSPGGDGLDAYRTIAAGAGAHLTEGGRIILEIGPSQAAAVSAIFREKGFGRVDLHRDLDGRDRALLVQK